MAECLRTKDPHDLVNREWDGVTHGILEFPFTPVLDGDFMKLSPAKALEANKFKHTNILLGANQEEGFYFIIYYITDIFKLQVGLPMTDSYFEKAISNLISSESQIMETSAKEPKNSLYKLLMQILAVT